MSSSGISVTGSPFAHALHNSQAESTKQIEVLAHSASSGRKGSNSLTSGSQGPDAV